MRLFALSLRFVLPLVIVLAVIAYGVVPVVDSLELKWFIRDLDMRSKLMVNTMEGPLAPLPCASETRFRKCDECPDIETCGTRIVMKQVRDATSKILDTATLASVCRLVDSARVKRQGGLTYDI